MGGDDYVIDEKRGRSWSNSHDALCWYRSELDRVEVERTWQPIETAPKDGRMVLLCTESRYPYAGYFMDEWLDTQHHVREPSHWMVLPPAPPTP